MILEPLKSEMTAFQLITYQVLLLYIYGLNLISEIKPGTYLKLGYLGSSKENRNMPRFPTQGEFNAGY